MFSLLGVFTVFLTISLVFATIFLWKFAKIIMIFEDDIDETLESLNNVENSMSEILNMQMFFDSPEAKNSVQGALEEIKLCKGVVNKIIHKFTARSKRKYVTVWENPEYFSGQQQQEEEFLPRLPGQPPGTPNPLETLRREGMILDVRHQNK